MGLGTRMVRLVILGRRRGYRARLLQALGLRSEPVEAVEPRSAAPAPTPPSDGFSEVVRLDELVPGELTEVMVDGRSVALARVGDDVLAVDGVCPHAGGPLGDGDLDGHVLTCPYHGWSFDLREGSCLTNPALRLQGLEVRVESGSVRLRWPAG